MVVFREGDIGPVEQFDIFEVEALPWLVLAVVQRKGMDGGSKQRVYLDGMGYCVPVGCEMIGRVVLFVPLQGLEEEVEAALLYF